MVKKDKSWGSLESDESPRATPFVKWAGGKTQILDQLLFHAPPANEINVYYEPFLGGGALFFTYHPKIAMLSDTNEDLINAYKVIKSHVKDLIKELKEGQYKNTKKDFYRIRGIDPLELTAVEKAARFK